MSVESKLDALLSGNAAILTAIQSIPGANTQPILDAVSKLQSELDQVSGTLGTEAPGPTPAPTTAPAS